MNLKYLIEDLKEQKQLSMKQATRNFAFNKEQAYQEVGKMLAYDDAIQKLQIMIKRQPTIQERIVNFFSNIKNKNKK